MVALLAAEAVVVAAGDDGDWVVEFVAERALYLGDDAVVEVLQVFHPLLEHLDFILECLQLVLLLVVLSQVVLQLSDLLGQLLYLGISHCQLLLLFLNIRCKLTVFAFQLANLAFKCTLLFLPIPCLGHRLLVLVLCAFKLGSQLARLLIALLQFLLQIAVVLLQACHFRTQPFNSILKPRPLQRLLALFNLQLVDSLLQIANQHVFCQNFTVFLLLLCPHSL